MHHLHDKPDVRLHVHKTHHLVYPHDLHCDQTLQVEVHHHCLPVQTTLNGSCPTPSLVPNGLRPEYPVPYHGIRIHFEVHSRRTMRLLTR